MAHRDLMCYVWKFQQLLVAGSRAGLTLNCKDGHAWVDMSVDLGPWRLPPHPPHQNNKNNRLVTPQQDKKMSVLYYSIAQFVNF